MKRVSSVLSPHSSTKQGPLNINNSYYLTLTGSDQFINCEQLAPLASTFHPIKSKFIALHPEQCVRNLDRKHGRGRSSKMRQTFEEIGTILQEREKVFLLSAGCRPASVDARPDADGSQLDGAARPERSKKYGKSSSREEIAGKMAEKVIEVAEMPGRFVGGPRVSDAPLQFVLFVCVYIYSGGDGGGGSSGGGSGRTRRDAPRNTNTSNTRSLPLPPDDQHLRRPQPPAPPP
ncbi:hypothetical protein GEV33_007084 [Tenebrio molitor]|uniref:Uncharacterized protein n=1 Tax=Tenebrio molitor TaxID=7067 RepID=A0A8J6HLE0_TENMO|nr:hypothetical protein GEV33_007084 [Tenebrio molitor]